jgi:hypothetical protein
VLVATTLVVGSVFVAERVFLSLQTLLPHGRLQTGLKLPLLTAYLLAEAFVPLVILATLDTPVPTRSTVLHHLRTTYREPTTIAGTVAVAYASVVILWLADVPGFRAATTVLAGNLLLLLLFQNAVIAPIEELLFRGALYTYLRQRTTVVVTVGVTIALFAVRHVLGSPLVPITPATVGGWFLCGAVLGGLRAWSDSLTLPILAHCAGNVVIIVALTAAS